MVLLIVVLPVTLSTPPRLAHLSKLMAPSEVTIRSRTIFATIRPMKKISPAAMMRGMNSTVVTSSVSTGPATAPRPKTLRIAMRPNSQINRATILPSDSPNEEPVPVARWKKETLSTSLAKAHCAALARAQVAMRIMMARTAFSSTFIATSSSKR